MEGAIFCTTDGGNKWLFRTGAGALFLMLHILGTMQSLGVAKHVFIKDVKGMEVENAAAGGESKTKDSNSAKKDN